MKIIFTVLLMLSFLCGSSFATTLKMNLDSRLDAVSVDNDQKKSEIPNYFNFQVSRLKLGFSGKTFGDFNYKLVLDLKSDAATVNAVDGLPSMVSTMLLSKEFVENLVVSFGKQSAAIGGIENDHNGADVYQYSLAMEQNPFGDEVGISAAYSIYDQKFIVQLLNGDKDTDPDGNNKQRNVSHGVAWYGNLMDLVKPIFSYHVRPVSDNANSGAQQTMLALGAAFIFDPVIFEFDYYSYNQEKMSGTNDLETQSVIGKLVYNGEKFKPFFKIFQDEYTDANTKQYERVGYVVALQFYPYPKENFRYHLSYSQVDYDYKVATTQDYTVQKFFLGLRANFDILDTQL